MAEGTATDGGHSILFVLSVHFVFSLKSCSRAMLAMLTACCVFARIWFMICIVVRHGAVPSVSLKVPKGHVVQFEPSVPV